MIPVLNASGCLDALTAPDVARSLDAFVTKTVTPLPREGNAPVRIAETEAGMLNSIGLANPGIDAFLAHHLPRFAQLRMPLWVSIGGFQVDDYASLAAVLDARDEVSVIELNVSCPNVEETPANAAEVVAAARAQTSKPIYAKLSPAVPDIAAVAVAVESAGADGLSLVNTIRGLVLERDTFRPVLGTAVGGYSGPALKPIALAAVYACYRATSLPIVGMGGIATGRDALDFVAAGASSIALGTALFADPEAPRRVRRELRSETARVSVVSTENAVGAAHHADEAAHTLDSHLRVTS